MSAVKGTYKLLYKDAKWFFTVFSCITLTLAVVYLLISVIFDVPEHTPAALFGPILGGIAAFSISGLILPFQVAIGMGSTRKQFMKSYYVMTTLMIVVNMTFLNLIYFVMDILGEKGINKFHFFHPGYFQSADYNIFAYYWFDIMTGFFIVGMASFITVLIKRLGILNFLIVLVLLSITATLLSVTGITVAVFERFLKTPPSEIFLMLGLKGIVFQLLTYPMMKNAPIKMKNRKA
jgi:hypothetical protein